MRARRSRRTRCCSRSIRSNSRSPWTRPRRKLGQVALSINATKEDYRRILNDIDAQSAQVDLAQTNFDRASSLLKTDFGTRATYDQTHFTLLAAQKTFQSLKQQAQVTLARLNGNADAPVETMPQWQQAKAQVDEAQRQLDHTVVRAPFAGIATQVDALQLGTYLVSQTAALTNTGAVGLVSTSHVWVDANLKETDLTYVKTGDPVKITVDSYPGRDWTGKVESISPASGSEFSILPPQNASGNWVKVVQRIPVRITVDAEGRLPASALGHERRRRYRHRPQANPFRALGRSAGGEDRCRRQELITRQPRTRRRSTAASSPCARWPPRLMQALDSTIANVALPYMQGSLVGDRATRSPGC